MTQGNIITCRICYSRTTQMIGFSAPMALPGEDRVDMSKSHVVTLHGYQGADAFQSIYELEAAATTDRKYAERLQGDISGKIYELA
jgi:hypothetical protein